MSIHVDDHDPKLVIHVRPKVFIHERYIGKQTETAGLFARAMVKAAA